MSPRKPASFNEFMNNLDAEWFDDDEFQLFDDEDLKSIQIPIVPVPEPEKSNGKRKRKP